MATTPELGALLRSGVFVPQLHLGALMLAGIRGHIDLSSLASPPACLLQFNGRGRRIRPVRPSLDIDQDGAARIVTNLASTNSLEAL